MILTFRWYFTPNSRWTVIGATITTKNKYFNYFVMTLYQFSNKMIQKSSNVYYWLIILYPPLILRLFPCFLLRPIYKWTTKEKKPSENDTKWLIVLRSFRKLFWEYWDHLVWRLMNDVQMVSKLHQRKCERNLNGTRAEVDEKFWDKIGLAKKMESIIVHIYVETQIGIETVNENIIRFMIICVSFDQK